MRNRVPLTAKERLPDLFVEDPNNSFVWTDPHFGHTNIIKYCDRPFRTTEEMNEVMLRNYRSVVRYDSLVFFLGDMAYGRGSMGANVWLEKIRTKHFIYVKGSHDIGIRTNGITVVPECFITLEGIPLFLVHDLHNAPIDWPGWVIHGHVHNRRPLVDKIHKRINTSVEVTGYRPLSLTQIMSLIKEAEK